MVRRLLAVIVMVILFSSKPASSKPSWRFNKFEPSEIQSVADIEEVLGHYFPPILDAISNKEQINAVLEVVRTCDRDNLLESCAKEAVRRSVASVESETQWRRTRTEL